tara:strand:- start:879 stop:1064 length:186 start_codon:yes stop_codon:yes gene_type:complete
MTKGKKLLDNAGAIENLEKQLADCNNQQGKLSALILKTQGALDVLRQIEEGVEVDDTKSTD